MPLRLVPRTRTVALQLNHIQNVLPSWWSQEAFSSLLVSCYFLQLHRRSSVCYSMQFHRRRTKGRLRHPVYRLGVPVCDIISEPGQRLIVIPSSRIQHATFSFGGRSGNICSCVAFRKPKWRLCLIRGSSVWLLRVSVPQWLPPAAEGWIVIVAVSKHMVYKKVGWMDATIYLVIQMQGNKCTTIK